MSPFNNIGEARRNYAEKVGKFTQEDAAEYFGVSLSTYKKWEQGKGKMNGEQLRDISRKYGVTTDFLLDVKPSVSYATVNPSERPSSYLTDDERELLRSYRNMNESGRDELMEYAAYLKARHPLNESVSRSA